MSVEPDIVELERVGLLGSNCTIWASDFYDPISCIAVSGDNPHLAGKAIHKDGAVQRKTGLVAWTGQRSRAGLSNTPKDFPLASPTRRGRRCTPRSDHALVVGPDAVGLGRGHRDPSATWLRPAEPPP